MGNLVNLRPVELIFVDAGHLDALSPGGGEARANFVAHAALEEIAERVNKAEAAWQAGEFARLGRLARSLVGMSSEAGLETVSIVAREVARAAEGRDGHALAALVARLVRVSEGSLAALWDIPHLRL